jgi:hypothetical protein
MSRLKKRTNPGLLNGIFFLALALAVGLLAGCGGAGNQQAASDRFQRCIDEWNSKANAETRATAPSDPTRVVIGLGSYAEAYEGKDVPDSEKTCSVTIEFNDNGILYHALYLPPIGEGRAAGYELPIPPMPKYPAASYGSDWLIGELRSDRTVSRAEIGPSGHAALGLEVMVNVQTTTPEELASCSTQFSLYDPGYADCAVSKFKFAKLAMEDAARGIASAQDDLTGSCATAVRMLLPFVDIWVEGTTQIISAYETTTTPPGVAGDAAAATSLPAIGPRMNQALGDAVRACGGETGPLNGDLPMAPLSSDPTCLQSNNATGCFAIRPESWGGWNAGLARWNWSRWDSQGAEGSGTFMFHGESQAVPATARLSDPGTCDGVYVFLYAEVHPQGVPVQVGQMQPGQCTYELGGNGSSGRTRDGAEPSWEQPPDCHVYVTGEDGQPVEVPATPEDCAGDY